MAWRKSKKNYSQLKQKYAPYFYVFFSWLCLGFLVSLFPTLTSSLSSQLYLVGLGLCLGFLSSIYIEEANHEK